MYFLSAQSLTGTSGRLDLDPQFATCQCLKLKRLFKHVYLSCECLDIIAIGIQLFHICPGNLQVLTIRIYDIWLSQENTLNIWNVLCSLFASSYKRERKTQQKCDSASGVAVQKSVDMACAHFCQHLMYVRIRGLNSPSTWDCQEPGGYVFSPQTHVKVNQMRIPRNGVSCLLRRSKQVKNQNEAL